MDLLESCDDNSVKYHSSISQNNGALAVMVQGEWLPLSYDELLYVGCDGIKTERACLMADDSIGYQFDVADCKYVIDTYVYHDNQTTELRTLPHWFGEGYYNKFVNEYDFINADNGSLGVRNEYDLRVGLNYALADETLEAEE